MYQIQKACGRRNCNSRRWQKTANRRGANREIEGVLQRAGKERGSEEKEENLSYELLASLAEL